MLKSWELRWLIISLIVLVSIVLLDEFFQKYLNDHTQLTSIIVGLGGGIIGAIFLVWIQRKNEHKAYKKYYSQISDRYVRVDIGQDDTPESDQENIRVQNIGLRISISHIEKNTIELEAEYWKNDKAKIKAIIEFVESNRHTGIGRYWYIEGDTYRDRNHMGEMILYRNRENDNQIIVRYHHIFPRQNENNPEKNHGWEIWERESKNLLTE